MCLNMTVLLLLGEFGFSPSPVFLSVVKSQDLHDQCTSSSCQPQLGDLMVGRAARLSASSTCGLNGPENYCIVGYLEGEKKCFICDSRLPYNPHTNPNSHQIENVISTFEPKGNVRWWQSENGRLSGYGRASSGQHSVGSGSDVPVQSPGSHLQAFSDSLLPGESMCVLFCLQSFRPAAMLVERSKDFGQSWKVIRYFAEDCSLHFPSVPHEPASNIDDVVCDSRYSGPEPSTGGEVVLKALDPVFEIENPFAPNIQELITLTNIRVNFTHLFTLGDTLLARRRRNPQDKYYYSVYNMVVQGSCFCNGHASRCVPEDRGRGDVFTQPDMVHGQCVCQHNTAGKNCERCQELYNDSPWRPGGELTSKTCNRCNCHGHSDSCHFNEARYAASGGVSGGVCDNCRHGRMGPQCDLCRPFLYQDPQLAPHDPQACRPCDCDPAGSLDGGLCDALTGRCFCKGNVEGQRCDQCRQGFFNLRQDNPSGCQECNCHSLGSVGSCDPLTGHCQCVRWARGPLCDRCEAGFWGLGNSVFSCSPCKCDIGGAHNNMCSPEDGQCHCLPNIVGQRCSEPAPGYFLPSLNYFLYEAELATPLSARSSSPIPPSPSSSSLVNPVSLPPCKQYFRDQGFDFKLSNGKVILVRKARHLSRPSRQQNTIHLEPGHALHLNPHQKSADQSGLGFFRVMDGEGLIFTVDNLPSSMEYELVIYFEPEALSDWLATVQIIMLLPGDGGCSDSPAGSKTLILPGNSRLALLDSGVCLNAGGRYLVEIHFQKQTFGSFSLLVDSMGLIQRIKSVQDFCSQKDRDSFHRFQCFGLAAHPGSLVPLPEVCERLIKSLSALVHQGAIACRCDVIGSLGPACSKLGGVCECKPNVIGRCCDTCAPLTFGFGPEGCKRCECDPRGSVSELCDQVRGQCACRSQVKGRRCDHCQPGFWGFPLCQRCECNGLSEICEEVTGDCRNCRDHTTGPSCNRCEVGYYGDPVSRQPCQPCLCPDTLSSGRFFATSCRREPKSVSVTCFCKEGHTGARCDRCSSGFYGNLMLPGAHCKPCFCNNNINLDDDDACDTLTGKCLRCLHNTTGLHCQHCKPGYYGNALQQDCKECSCDREGTEAAKCLVGHPCFCDPETGQCPCKSGVVGDLCDECEDGFWSAVGASGCQPCRCDPANSISNICNKLTGQCPCHPEFGGRRCDECGQNHFRNSNLQCISCDCNMEGTERPSCDPETGECLCRTGVAGIFCDECAPGHDSEFPACNNCHPCTSLWAQHVTDVQLAAQRMKTFIPHRGKTSQHPTNGHYWQQMLTMHSELDSLTNLTNLSLSKMENMEKLHRKIRKLKDAVDSNTILIDPSPLLHAEIDSVHLESEKLLTNLKEKLKNPNKKENQPLEEILDEIQKLHKTFISDEKRLKESIRVLEDSMDTRQEVHLKLSMCRSRGNLAELEQKVKELSVLKLSQKICGRPSLKKCSECGQGQFCDGVAPVTQKASKMAENVKKQLLNLPSTLQESMRKIIDVKLLAENFADQTSDLQDQIRNITGALENEKSKTNDLIQRVQLYLMDEMVPPEDIENMAKFVLSVQLPRSPAEVQSVISDIINLINNATKLQDDIKKLQEKNQTAEELLQKAEKLKRYKTLDVKAISGDVSAAVGAQIKANDNLKAANQDRNKTKDHIQDAEDILDHIEKKLMSPSEDLLREIQSVKNKTQQNREMAREAKENADSALNNISQTDLQVVMKQFEVLKEHFNQSGDANAAEQLKKILMEAEDLQRQVEDKLQQMQDMEQKTLQQLERKKQKEAEVAELLETVESLQQEITSRANGFTICSS